MSDSPSKMRRLMSHREITHRMGTAAMMLKVAHQALAEAKKSLDELSPLDHAWMNDVGECGWWYDTSEALRKLRKWERRVKKFGFAKEHT